MKTLSICLAAVLAFVALPLHAETQYVTDKLRLGVHLTRDTSGTPFTYLNSGDAVDVLERDGRLTFVKLADERTGWVRGSFLQSEEPALRRIAGVDAENERLKAEVESLRSNDSAAEIDQLRAQAAAANERAKAAENDRLKSQSELRSMRERLEALQAGVPLWWLLTAVGIALVSGAFGAWRWFDYRSRRRHGGFRVY